MPSHHQQRKQQDLSKQEEQICSVCETEPQDMLILSCKHNLCLQCATEVFQLSQKGNMIVCEICLEQTHLDEDTIVCLRSLSAKSYKSQEPSSQRQQQCMNIPLPQNKKKESNYSANRPQSHQNSPSCCGLSSPNRRNEQFIQHPDPYYQQSQPVQSSMICGRHQQPIVYFCFDCNNNFQICSECMLLENHRDHNVATLKKAALNIKQHVYKACKQKTKLRALLEKDRNNLVSKKENSEKQHQANMHQLKATFDILFKAVRSRYEQLSNQLEEQALRKIQIMEGAVNQIDSKVRFIDQITNFEQEIVESFSQQHQNSKFQLFEYFKNEMDQNNVSFEPNLPAHIPQVHQTELCQNSPIFEELISCVSALGFQQDQNDEKDKGNSYLLNYMSGIESDIGLGLEVAAKQQMQQYPTDSSSKAATQLFNKHTNGGVAKRQVFNISSGSSCDKDIKASQSSQNINIIQVVNNRKQPAKERFAAITKQQKTTYNNNKNTYKAPMKNSSIQPGKNSSTGLHLQENKRLSNYQKDQLTKSRKMELSRSIINATDIINKIQERSSRY